jgi:ferrous iron transport protein A
MMCLEIILNNLKEGQSGRIVRLEGGQHFQRKLRTIGIREGKKILVLAKQPLGGPIVVEIDGRDTTIGRRMAGRIIVEL